ncbi:uncharacterized protein BDZ99DRAFT_165029 [Mytilinidion resinicola]|uniref:Uncharacterized protein n=1 Tax=Mytilinidion resinicola TaxID=574789 RepID=A0A6A6Y3N9_9PEZI|nr:uncharacterized protein BDZ99DRAFT_165029 [Mytilinidion resinicola]KAF2803451.1 hypothetical protein BDZ99DRAFT_165029 [Mytilinidion resinicola]
MSYYDNASWPAPGRQPSWEQQPPPSRSGASSTVNRDEIVAFSAQFEEVDRAAENLAKSGKSFGVGTPGPGRRDSMPINAGRPYSEYGGPQRHHSVSEYDGIRSHSASNLQGYYANQRFAPRPNDADQMAQAKRRMAAQRERELRNYHQEQQYHRSVHADVSGAKSDRSMSPNAMSEEDRRELIARQHRALYGDGSTLYGPEGTRTSSQDARVATSSAGRGASPLAFDPFGMQSQGASGEGSVQMPSREQMSSKDTSAGAQQERATSNSSPSSSQPNTSFNLFENAQQSSRTSNSSPGGSPPRQGAKAATGVAPIGTRPAQNQASPPGAPLSKRSTTPLPSPLSYSYNASEQQNNNNNNDHNSSASSNPSSSVADKGVGLGWGSNSGVWGPSKNTLGVQASVWG